MPLLASVLIAELMLLLVAPMAYCALLLPKSVGGPPFPARTIPGPELPLTNSQIKAAWPHLPTSQQIADSNYTIVTSSYQPQNETAFAVSDVYSAPPGAYVCYNIWLQLNSTTWIQVPYHYLATSKPPYPQYIQARSTGFLGTGLPTPYIIVAVIAIVATLLAGLTYLLRKRGGFQQEKSEKNP